MIDVVRRRNLHYAFCLLFILISFPTESCYLFDVICWLLPIIHMFDLESYFDSSRLFEDSYHIWTLIFSIDEGSHCALIRFALFPQDGELGTPAAASPSQGLACLQPKRSRFVLLSVLRSRIWRTIERRTKTESLFYLLLQNMFIIVLYINI